MKWFLFVAVFVLVGCVSPGQNCGMVSSDSPGVLRSGAAAIERCEQENRQRQAAAEVQERQRIAAAAATATALAVPTATATPWPTMPPTSTPEPTATATVAPTPEPTVEATSTAQAETTSTPAPVVAQTDSADDDAARMRLYVNSVIATVIVLGGLAIGYFVLRPRTFILPGRGRKP